MSKAPYKLVTRIVVAMLLLSGTVAAVGCTGEKQSDTAWLDEDEIATEYEAAAADLELPPGFVFPEMPLDPAVGSYGEGSGLVAAQMYWQRAWELEWLEQRGKDPAREAVAFDILKNRVPEAEFMTKHADDSTHNAWAGYVAQAEMGDPGGIQRDIDVNPMTIAREDGE